MQWFDNVMIPPTGHYLDLLRFLSVLAQMVHLPYMGMVIGATAVSMWFTFSDYENPNPNHSRFAGDLLRVFLGNRAALLVFGVFPLIVFPMIYGQFFSGLQATPLNYLIPAEIGILIGLALLVAYKNSFAARAGNFHRHMGLGTLAVLVLMVSYFVLLASIARLNDPETWFRVTSVGIMLLNWNVIWKFLFFVHASFALTGAGVLFFFFHWPSYKIEGDPEYSKFVRYFGAGLAMAFCFAIPVFYLFFIFTTPDVAFDGSVYAFAAGLVFAAMIAGFVLHSVVTGSRPRYGAQVFGLFLVVFLLGGIVDQKTMGNANQEHVTLLKIEEERRKQEREIELQAAMAGAHDENRGETVYQTICSACHKFDEKLVGPPMGAVLKKYADAEALKAFIKNPQKVDPAYPPMPNPGLSDGDAAAVAEYLMGQVGGDGATQTDTGH